MRYLLICDRYLYIPALHELIDLECPENVRIEIDINAIEVPDDPEASHWEKVNYFICQLKKLGGV